MNDDLVYLEDGSVMPYDEYIAMTEAAAPLLSVPSEESVFFYTPFSEYTVSEGLLLLLVFAAYLALLVRVVRRWF